MILPDDSATQIAECATCPECDRVLVLGHLPPESKRPFVQGRDMDLSLAAFLTIADRSQGKIQATFERIGDSTVVRQCDDGRMQRRIESQGRVPFGKHKPVSFRILGARDTQPAAV